MNSTLETYEYCRKIPATISIDEIISGVKIITQMVIFPLELVTTRLRYVRVRFSQFTHIRINCILRKNKIMLCF